MLVQDTKEVIPHSAIRLSTGALLYGVLVCAVFITNGGMWGSTGSSSFTATRRHVPFISVGFGAVIGMSRLTKYLLQIHWESEANCK